jgi:hypothetical protein
MTPFATSVLFQWQNEVSSDLFSAEIQCQSTSKAAVLQLMKIPRFATGAPFQWQNRVFYDSFCHWCSFFSGRTRYLLTRFGSSSTWHLRADVVRLIAAAISSSFCHHQNCFTFGRSSKPLYIHNHEVDTTRSFQCQCWRPQYETRYCITQTH